MMRQPDDFVAVNAEITNPGKPNKFKNYDAVGKVPHAMKTESQRKPTESMAKATQKKAALKKPTPGAAPGKAMKTGGKSTPTNVVAPQPKKGRNESRQAFVKEASGRLLERLLSK